MIIDRLKSFFESSKEDSMERRASDSRERQIADRDESEIAKARERLSQVNRERDDALALLISQISDQTGTTGD